MSIINQIVKGSGGSAPAHYIQRNVDTNGKLVKTGSMSIIDMTGVTDIGDYALYREYEGNTNISGTVHMGDLVQITGTACCQKCFYGCTGITGVNLSSLKTINTPNATDEANYPLFQMFSGSGLSGVLDLSNLETVNGQFACTQWFANCTGITGINITKLKTIGTSAFGNVFRGCTGITGSIFFSALEQIGNYGIVGLFNNCVGITEINFPALKTVGTSCFNVMCTGMTNVTLHFPSNMQSAIEAQTGYSTTAPFGATSGTVLFDLPATS